MAFDVRIEFSGLCAYVIHPDNQHIAVIMPDARAGVANVRHEDGSIGAAHSGYARFNLANILPNVPVGSASAGPAYETVHRFSAELMDLGLPAADGPISGAPQMPEVTRFAPMLRLLPDALGGPAHTPTLMRLLLRGGTVTAMGKQKHWRFSDVLNPGQAEYSGQFASVVLWSRHIEAADLTVTIRAFNGAHATTLKLSPVDEGHGAVITIKMANLCSQNPLEWPDLEPHFINGDDVDFKWLYRLYAPGHGTLGALLQGEPLPVPMQSLPQTFGTQGCMGAVTTTAFDTAAFIA